MFPLFFSYIAVHREPSQQAGKVIKVKDTVPFLGGKKLLVVDWFDRTSLLTWQFMHRYVCYPYAFRATQTLLPLDNEVLLARIDDDLMLVHVKEIEDDQAKEKEAEGTEKKRPDSKRPKDAKISAPRRTTQKGKEVVQTV